MQLWSLVVATLMLGSAWGAMSAFSSEEPVVQKRPFAEFPLELAGRWEGKELGLDDSVLAVLRLDDYMMRVYRKREARVPGHPLAATRKAESGRPESGAVRKPPLSLPHRSSDEDEEVTPPVWLYVGYYRSQRTGATYHSPKNCLPGAGWHIVATDPLTIQVSDGQVITVNHVLIQKGLDRQVILYWYHDRGRVIASEYWAKAYLIWDAMTRNRTDGALVRVSVPVVTTVDQALHVGVSFIQDMWPLLLRYMPDPTPNPL